MHTKCRRSRASSLRCAGTRTEAHRQERTRKTTSHLLSLDALLVQVLCHLHIILRDVAHVVSSDEMSAFRRRRDAVDDRNPTIIGLTTTSWS
jgi:hypothetical protein